MRAKRVVHTDERGSFSELLRSSKDNVPPMVQLNHLTSKKGAVRGLHYAETTQWKSTVVLKGKVLHVIVPVEGFFSEGECPFEVRVLVPGTEASVTPPHHAHALVALEDSEMLYASSVEYDGALERTLNLEGVSTELTEVVGAFMGETKLLYSEKDLQGQRRTECAY